MSIFFDEDKALTPKANESWSRGPRTSISENFSAVSKAFSLSELSISEYNNLAEEYGNAVQILHESGNTNFVSPLDEVFNWQTGTGFNNETGFVETRSREDLEKDFWRRVNEASKNNEELTLKLNEAGLGTYENMQKKIATKAHDAWKEYAEISSRATTSAKIFGGFGGMALTSFKDPFMQAGLVASFGYQIPATFGKAAWKVARYEAVIGGVSEALIQLKSQPYRAELGFEDAGLETGLKNIFMVAGASATLSPVLMGVFKAFGKGYDVGKKHLFKLSDEELQQVGKELGELNPKYKRKELDNFKLQENDNPFPNNAAGRTEHRERLDLAVKSVNEATELDLPPPKNKIIYHSTDKVFRDFDVSKSADFSTWFTDNVNAIKKGITGASGKGIIVERSIDETKLNLATRAEADKLTDDQLIAKGYDGVKFDDLGAEEGVNYRIFFPEKLDEVPAANQSASNKANFNRDETSVAQDIEAAKNFDVPTEATYRNQASLDEGSMFDEGTSLAIRSEAGAGAAAKTVPTGKFSSDFQDLLSKSQTTDTAPSSKVLATAQSTPPPLTRGETNKVVGDFNSMGKPIYHKTDDFNEIYNTLSSKIEEVKADLLPFATKYDGELKARIKDKDKIAVKMKVKDISAQNISDFLGARISVDTITAAKLLFSDLNKKFKLIGRDDFLDDVGRTLTHKTQYRRIHLQALTKDGFSFEIQVSLKDLDPIFDRSHDVYTEINYKFKNFWAKPGGIDKDAINRLLREQKDLNNEMETKYFKIKDKEFDRANPTNDVDIPYVFGTRLDENGEIQPLMTTAREAFEQDAKATTMLKRLENCV